MSNDQTPQAAKADQPHENFFYFVDGDKYESDTELTTGAAIKARLPESKRGYALFLEGHANNPDTPKMPDHMDVVLKDFPDELYYKRVTRGIDGTPMAPWGLLFPHLYLWKAESYARTFHDPLASRTAKKPVPPIPTKEEIERWKKDGLFLDPLL